MLHYATHDIEKKFKSQPWENIQQPFWATQRKTSLSLQGQCTKLSPSICPGVSARDGWAASLRHGYWQAWWNNGWSKLNLKTLQINPSNDWSSAFNLVEAIKFKFDQRIRGINVVTSRNNNKKARSPGRNWKNWVAQKGRLALIQSKWWRYKLKKLWTVGLGLSWLCTMTSLILTIRLCSFLLPQTHSRVLNFVKYKGL